MTHLKISTKTNSIETADSRVRRLGEEAAIRSITADEALFLATAPGDDAFWALLDGADRLRRRFRGEAVTLCAIVNAKSGRCGEDCKFCSQSARWDAKIDEYGFIGNEEVLAAARDAVKMGASEFSMVVAGRNIRETELRESETIFSDVERETGMIPCASPGAVGVDDIDRLKSAGLRMFHHNLETGRSHYGAVCTTRSFDANLATVKAAKARGLFVCSGGIFGMGETWEQRIELFMELREADVDSVPINFLNPIDGTPFEGRWELTPKECLRIIAAARHILPKKQIVICGGRAVNLRELQPLIFHAGASGMMIGNYLTTKGRDAKDDHRMLHDLGIPVVPYREPPAYATPCIDRREATCDS